VLLNLCPIRVAFPLLPPIRFVYLLQSNQLHHSFKQMRVFQAAKLPQTPFLLHRWQNHQLGSLLWGQGPTQDWISLQTIFQKKWRRCVFDYQCFAPHLLSAFVWWVQLKGSLVTIILLKGRLEFLLIPLKSSVFWRRNANYHQATSSGGQTFFDNLTFSLHHAGAAMLELLIYCFKEVEICSTQNSW
jgi:hypothetical protein